MRNNQPVTRQNYAMPPDQTLVSVTDLKGRITYCNPAFIEVSGYAREIHQLINESGERLQAGSQQTGQALERMQEALKAVGAVGTVLEGVSNSMRLFRLSRGELTLSQMDAVNLRREFKALN